MSDTALTVAVLGIGGVGGTLAAVLSSRGVDVTCIDREPVVEAVRENGLTLESKLFGRLETRPRAATALAAAPGLFIITTKAWNLDAALERIDRALLKESVILPLLNGLEHVEKLRARLGRRVAPGSIRIEASTDAPGHIIHASPSILIKMASDRDVPRAEVERVAAFLTRHGIDTQVGKSEADVMWEKLFRWPALACTTALTEQGIGFIRDDAKWGPLLEAAVREGVAVARACGAAIAPEEQLRYIRALPATLFTSLARDVLAGRPSELDSNVGAVVRAGQRVGVPCPTIADLMAHVEAKAAQRRQRQPLTGV
jgi:2-dehydropantoate 2-reductase